MSTPAAVGPSARGTRIEGIAQIIIMLAIGGAAGAASFTHVHNVAQAHGQGGWLAWADAIVLELMSIASGLEMRRRKRQYKGTIFPGLVLTCAVTLSISAQVVEAERSLVGWIAAALPALGFLVMVKIALGRMTPERTGTGPNSIGDSDLRVQPARRVSSVPTLAENGGTRRVMGTRRSSEHDAVASASVSPGRRTTGAPDVEDLMPAAVAAQEVLKSQGRPLTHRSLTEQLRIAGVAVSNARGAAILKAIKATKPHV